MKDLKDPMSNVGEADEESSEVDKFMLEEVVVLVLVAIVVIVVVAEEGMGISESLLASLAIETWPENAAMWW